ncbi:MAG: hypothetical protein LBG71_08300 [Clostridiales Family XIII bacterium]|jgi:hypothetical protein|nr:hypothetical protein [Clostridiales Family XIII bacterium]
MINDFNQKKPTETNEFQIFPGEGQAFGGAHAPHFSQGPSSAKNAKPLRKTLLVVLACAVTLVAVIIASLSVATNIAVASATNADVINLGGEDIISLHGATGRIFSIRKIRNQNYYDVLSKTIIYKGEMSDSDRDAYLEALVWSNKKTMRTLGRKSPLERLATFQRTA